MYKTILLVTYVGVLAFTRELSPECSSVSIMDNGCQTQRLSMDEVNQKCKAFTTSLSTFSFFLKPGENFRFLEAVVVTQDWGSVRTKKLKAGKVILREPEKWYHLRIKERLSLPFNAYNLYVSGHKIASESFFARKSSYIEINISGSFELALHCKPATPQLQTTPQSTPASATRPNSTKPPPYFLVTGGVTMAAFIVVVVITMSLVARMKLSPKAQVPQETGTRPEHLSSKPIHTLARTILATCNISPQRTQVILDTRARPTSLPYDSKQSLSTHTSYEDDPEDHVYEEPIPCVRGEETRHGESNIFLYDDPENRIYDDIQSFLENNIKEHQEASTDTLQEEVKRPEDQEPTDAGTEDTSISSQQNPTILTKDSDSHTTEQPQETDIEDKLNHHKPETHATEQHQRSAEDVPCHQYPENNTTEQPLGTDIEDI